MTSMSAGPDFFQISVKFAKAYTAQALATRHLRNVTDCTSQFGGRAYCRLIEVDQQTGDGNVAYGPLVE